MMVLACRQNFAIILRLIQIKKFSSIMKVFMLIVIFSIIIPKTVASSLPNIPIAQMNALSDLYYSTNGSNWQWLAVKFNGEKWNFTGYHNPCLENWQGIACNTPCEYNCTVEIITLERYNMSGTIPTSINNITTLTTLNFLGNQLVGTIPDISQLSELRYLDLQSNELAGPFPPSLCTLQKIGYLDLANNRLSGTIPEAIGNMTGLVQALLGFNNFNGTIPASLARLQALEQVILKGNELTGTIPLELGSLPKLLYLTLSRNYLDGTIPPALGTQTFLYYLDLSHNSLSGSVPPTFALLNNLTFLVLNTNKLTGEITSDMLDAWPNMHDFYLNDNQFTGTVPGVKSSHLYYYEINTNLFTGTIPAYLFSSNQLNYMDVSGNYISGFIPLTIGASYNVEYIAMDNNLLSGTIPDTIGYLKYLVDLLLYSNLLSGTLPSTLNELHILESIMLQDNKLTGNLNNLINATAPLTFINENDVSGYNASFYQIISSIDVSGNSFTGSIPPEIFTLPRLLTFAAVSNCLSGTLPLTICNASTVTSLALDGLSTSSTCQQKIFPNTRREAYLLPFSLEDNVPWCMFALPQLVTLHLSGNGITGTIPSDIVLGASLSDLSLSHNKLSGSIPLSIQQREWAQLGLSYNKLNGILEPSFALGGFNSTLSMNVNRLSGNIPVNITNAANIDVLEGGIFSCGFDKQGAPPKDQAYDNYSCGSNEFYVSVFMWAFVCGLWALMITLAVVQFKQNSSGNRCLPQFAAVQFLSHILQQCVEWMATFDVKPLENFGVYNAHSVFAFGQFCGNVRYKTLVASLLLVFLALPGYIALSYRYQTYTYLYAWTASAMFKSGEICAYTLLVGFTTSLAVVFYFAQTSLQKKSEKPPTPTAQAIVPAAKAKQQTNWQALKLQLAFAVGLTPALLINGGAMVGVNIGYVYISQNYDVVVVTFTQFALASFKLFWNEYAVRNLLSMSVAFLDRAAPVATPITAVANTPENSAEALRLETVTFLRELKEAIRFRTFVLLFNNIITPFLSFVVVSPVCFYNIFFDQLTVETNYALCLGVVGTADTRCKASALTVFFTSYKPPFTYSYQCSSTFVQSYASMYVFMFLIIAFAHPILHLGTKFLFDYTTGSKTKLGKLVYKVCKYFLTPLLRPLPKNIDTLLDKRVKKSAKDLAADQAQNEAELDEMIRNSFRMSNYNNRTSNSVLGRPNSARSHQSVRAIQKSLVIDTGGDSNNINNNNNNNSNNSGGTGDLAQLGSNSGSVESPMSMTSHNSNSSPRTPINSNFNGNSGDKNAFETINQHSPKNISPSHHNHFSGTATSSDGNNSSNNSAVVNSSHSDSGRNSPVNMNTHNNRGSVSISKLTPPPSPDRKTKSQETKESQKSGASGVEPEADMRRSSARSSSKWRPSALFSNKELRTADSSGPENTAQTADDNGTQHSEIGAQGAQANRTNSIRFSRTSSFIFGDTRERSETNRSSSSQKNSSIRSSTLGSMLNNFFMRSNQENRREGRLKTVFFSKSRFTLHIVTEVAILLTFGVVFPPLAVMVCVSMFSYTAFVQLCMGRFLVLAQKHKDYLRIKSVLESECSGASVQIREAFPLLIVFAAIFYSLFLFDTLGDVVGAMDAVWIGALMIFMPAIIYWTWKGTGRLVLLCQNYQTANELKRRRQRSRSASESEPRRSSVAMLSNITNNNSNSRSSMTSTNIQSNSNNRGSILALPVHDLDESELLEAGNLSHCVATVNRTSVIDGICSTAESHDSDKRVVQSDVESSGSDITTTENPLHDITT